MWRRLSLRGSHTSSRSLRHREGRYGGPIPIQEPRVFELQRAVVRTSSNSSYDDHDDVGAHSNSQSNATKDLLDWSEMPANENVDWYNEYIARHAPLSLSWLPHATEIRGMGLLKKDGDDTLVTPMEDGSVCLWNLGHDADTSDTQAGQIKGRSDLGTLFNPTPRKHVQTHISSDNAVECVSVDQFSHRAYFAARSVLTEVDLCTLQATSRQTFEDQICSLSDGGIHPNPLTVGTTKSVHIYDPRNTSRRPSLSCSISLTEGLASLDPPQSDPDRFPDFQRLYSGDPPRSKHKRFARIDPLPLSTIHISHNIHVGGRFPSILTYDRRFFPQTMTSIYSGARISALTSFTSPNGTQQTLVAAGEYKGKGSLELYPRSYDDTSLASQ